MRDTEPSVSTAGSRRMMALRWAMRCTPIASVMVMSAGNPSGISDTAMPTTSLEELDEAHVPQPVSIGEDQHADHSDGCCYGIAELLDLAQERSFERAHVREQLVDAA